MPVVMPLMDGGGILRAVRFVQVLVSTTVIGFDIPVNLSPRHVLVSVHTGAIRFRWDGGLPTSTLGHLLTGVATQNDAVRVFELTGTQTITAFRMVRDGTTDAEVAYTLEI